MMLEMNSRAIDVVGLERASDASLGPVGAEHEMLNDQLAPPIEQLGQRLFAIRPLERVRLLDFDPRQITALFRERIELTGQLLLFREEEFSRDDPFLARDGGMLRHTEYLT